MGSHYLKISQVLATVDPERLHEPVVNCWFLSLGAKTYRILVALVIAGSEGVPTTSRADPAQQGQSSAMRLVFNKHAETMWVGTGETTMHECSHCFLGIQTTSSHIKASIFGALYNSDSHLFHETHWRSTDHAAIGGISRSAAKGAGTRDHNGGWGSGISCLMGK